MIAKLQALVRALRENRVRVSTAELLDATAALAVVGVEQRRDVYAALAATLCKRAADRKTFDELFDLTFLSAAALVQKLERARLVVELRQAGLEAAQVERLMAELAEALAELPPSARAALGLGDVDAAALLAGATAALAGAQMSSPLQIGYQTNRVLEAMAFDGAARALAEIRAAADRQLPPGVAKALGAVIEGGLAGLRAAVRALVQREFERQNLGFAEAFRARSLAERPFFRMTESDHAALRLEVRRLARKLEQQVARRARPHRRGRLDVRRTLRASLRSGGVPFQVERKHRRPARPRLVVLCDISDSVRTVSRFMLEFVYTIHELLGSVRAFVFVADLGEVSPLFRSHRIERAVDLAYGGAVINVSANSDYGRALGQFVSRHLEVVTSRTTVLVIGDARSNHNPPRVEALAAIAGRARQIVWLNPEATPAWGFGDSAMRVYEPWCKKVVVAGNLASLRRVIDDLVLA